MIIEGYDEYDSSLGYYEQPYEIQRYIGEAIGNFPKEEQEVEFQNTESSDYRPMSDGSVPKRAHKEVYFDAERSLKVVVHYTYNKPIEAPDFLSRYVNNITIEQWQQ